MSGVIADRMTARIEGDFVVFLIGVRINKPWKIGAWLPTVRAMPRMLAELQRLPAEQTGFLGHTGLARAGIVQYWRSFAHLEAYARADDRHHFPAWVDFNRRLKDRRGDVGIWHETYLVKAGQYETLYSGMPPHGLGCAAELVPATGGRAEARGRLQA
ncbi:DUF4188 domain-containing protein [Sulfitobacter sp. D35]|uniref:DUF4188 domain-containing protein n=1 Tax=Sulfitobacter sp. D35 TaxID=3083252 RepID=UPI00296EE781|nr:DUF4188 domain-containing protein [Sulfitobacter sp. D35]MDW4500111.1 DUF4188 domain-containing protein [Sulfitobacter sp. D35]